MELISGSMLAHTVWKGCLESRCSVCVNSVIESSATCLASISSLLSEAQDEALYILVILLLLLITLHNTFQRLPPPRPSNLLSKMSNALILPPPTAETLHFNSAVTVMRQETALPHPQTVKERHTGFATLPCVNYRFTCSTSRWLRSLRLT